MAPGESGSTHQDEHDDLSQMKRKLAWRMSVAGLMIVGLLGALMLFDRLATGPSESEPAAPRFTEPVPVPKKSVTQALGAVEPALGPVKEEKKETTQSAPEATTVPADRAVPGSVLPPQREVAAQSSAERSAKQASRPVSAAPATVAAGVASEPKGGATAPPSAAGPDSSLPSRPSAPVVPPKLISGYTLQAGVFADPRRAEDLHAKLVQEGIPATLETRVLVGPFRSREDADAARAKMLVLGVDALQLPRSGKK